MQLTKLHSLKPKHALREQLFSQAILQAASTIYIHNLYSYNREGFITNPLQSASNLIKLADAETGLDPLRVKRIAVIAMCSATFQMNHLFLGQAFPQLSHLIVSFKKGRYKDTPWLQGRNLPESTEKHRNFYDYPPNVKVPSNLLNKMVVLPHMKMYAIYGDCKVSDLRSLALHMPNLQRLYILYDYSRYTRASLDLEAAYKEYLASEWPSVRMIAHIRYLDESYMDLSDITTYGSTNLTPRNITVSRLVIGETALIDKVLVASLPHDNS